MIRITKSSFLSNRISTLSLRIKKIDRENIFFNSIFSEIKKRFPKLVKLVSDKSISLWIFNDFIYFLRTALNLGLQLDSMSPMNRQSKYRHGKLHSYAIPPGQNWFKSFSSNTLCCMIRTIVSNCSKLITSTQCSR